MSEIDEIEKMFTALPEVHKEIDASLEKAIEHLNCCSSDVHELYNEVREFLAKKFLLGVFTGISEQLTKGNYCLRDYWGHYGINLSIALEIAPDKTYSKIVHSIIFEYLKNFFKDTYVWALNRILEEHHMEVESLESFSKYPNFQLLITIGIMDSPLVIAVLRPMREFNAKLAEDMK